MISLRFLTVLLFVPLLAACQPEHKSSYDSWTGRWQGPEGTYLDLQKSEADDEYNVVIADLDGPRTFKGHTTDEGIMYARNGATEIIKAGNGQATGMKWLADKKNCLVVKAGEGFCRD